MNVFLHVWIPQASSPVCLDVNNSRDMLCSLNFKIAQVVFRNIRHETTSSSNAGARADGGMHTDQVEQVALGGAPSFPGGRAVGREFDAIEFSGRKCQLTVQSE